MSTYGARLKRAMTHAKLDRRQLAEKIGASVQAVGQALQGKTSGFKLHRHLKTAAVCGVNQEWLFSGEGEMLGEPVKVAAGAAILARELADYFDEMVPKDRVIQALAYSAATDAISDTVRAWRKSSVPAESPNPEKLP